MLTIKQEVLDIVQSQYDVLEIIDFVYHDSKISELEHLLSKYQDYTFKFDQRIIFLHHDTDYYVSNTSYGFTLYNLFSILNKFQIPQEFLLLFTNNYGIIDEIDKLSKQICNTQPMKTIYTALWYDFPDDINQSVESRPIEKLFCCLNGVNRIHRILTLCYFKEYDLLDKGMVSYHFNK